jgi:uncharacterized protein YcbX
MKVGGLWRYPVKSMQGESCTIVDVTKKGIVGDRRYGILDIGSGTIVSAKKDGRVLEGRAFLAGVELTIRLPTGETLLALGAGVDTALSGWLGRPVHLIEARADGRGTYEMPINFEDDQSDPIQWQGPSGAFVDTSPVHLLTTATLAAVQRERPDLQWHLSRFRPNLVINTDSDDTDPEDTEDGWIGKRLTIGEVELQVYKPCSRCVMTTRVQPGGIERQLDILRHINTAHETNLGVHARVLRPGRIEVGQPVALSATSAAAG